MDNLTHSLIGAALGQAGLKRRTGLAMPALILAANLPDIDAGCVIYGIESLSMRRGITHGPIALALLPVLLAGALWWFDRWQTQRGKRPERRLPVHFGWLLALCYLGTFSHPLFDWFNNYGIRLLEPFSSTWFYGDTLFIIDIWILIALGLGLWRSLRRERAGVPDWAVPAQLALAMTALYVGANVAISRSAVTAAREIEPEATLLVANPVPLAFWHREVLWRSADGFYGAIPCDFNACKRYPRKIAKLNWPDPELARVAEASPQARAFLFWSRMPLAQPIPGGVRLKDQRFLDSPVSSNFTVELRTGQ